jgi:hypothetical protein
VEVIQVTPEPTLSSEMVDKLDQSLILVDYLLDQMQPDGSLVDYRGALLAAAAREKYPDKPIVILTQKAKISNDPADVKDFAGIYDDLIFKDDFFDERGLKSTALALVNLIEGFNRLTQAKTRGWPELLDALGAQEFEESQLISSDPPTSEGAWRVPEAARWIRKVLLGFPGILYDSLHAATALGIDRDAFLHDLLQSYFQDCKYTGVFASPDDCHWWTKRLIARAHQVMAEAELEDYLPSGFSEAWEKHTGMRLEPSKCVYSDEQHADCVCWFYKMPVMRKYSLPYLPDNRPAVMDTARLSFKAILNQNFDERRFREDARGMVKAIREEAREA